MSIILVCGPPCSGKSTYVEQYAPAGANVICLDTTARSIGSPVQWMHDRHTTEQADALVRQAIDNINPNDPAPTYIIRSLPRASEREALAHRLNAQVVLLDPGEDECHERAIQDRRPSGTARAIKLWYWAARKG